MKGRARSNGNPPPFFFSPGANFEPRSALPSNTQIRIQVPPTFIIYTFVVRRILKSSG